MRAKLSFPFFCLLVFVITLAVTSYMQLPEIPKLGGGEAEVSSPTQILRIAWNVSYYDGFPRVDGVWITFTDSLPQGTQIFAYLLDKHDDLISSGNLTLASELPGETPVAVSTSPPASPSAIYKIKLIASASITSAEVSFNAEGLGSDATGNILTVDSTGYTFADIPKTFTWLVNSNHTFEWTETVGASSGKRYVWTSTSGLSTARSGTIIVPFGGGSVTAAYKTQYYLTVSSAYDWPTPASGWFDSGTGITASVTSPVSGGTGVRYTCTGWTGTGSVPSSGSDTSVYFVIDAPSSITWNWKTQYQWTFSASGLGSDASGTVVTVDSTNYAYSNLPVSFWWDSGSSHSYAYQQYVGSSTSGKRYANHNPPSWSGTVSAPGNLNPSYHTEYQLTIDVSPSGGGSTNPAPGTYWHDSGAQVQVTATPNQGYLFSHWLLDGNNAGSSNPITVQMNSAHTLTAVFAQIHTEERYFGYHTHTVNGLTAIRLLVGPDVSYRMEGDEAIVDGQITITWGIRVWKRSSAGTETEITSGTPVALVSRNSNGQGLQSATWSCPEVNLDPTDSIVVRVYMDFEGWRLLETFTTEQLGAQKLLSSTWTVYYYTYYNLRLVGGEEGDLVLTARFYHGNSGYPSRIAGFKWA